MKKKKILKFKKKTAKMILNAIAYDIYIHIFIYIFNDSIKDHSF